MLRCVTAAGNQHRAPPEWRPVPPATAFRNCSVHHPRCAPATSASWRSATRAATRRTPTAMLVEFGRGDVPLTELPFRCSQCGSDRTEFVVTSRDNPQPWWAARDGGPRGKALRLRPVAALVVSSAQTQRAPHSGADNIARHRGNWTCQQGCDRRAAWCSSPAFSKASTRCTPWRRRRRLTVDRLNRLKDRRGESLNTPE